MPEPGIRAESTSGANGRPRTGNPATDFSIELLSALIGRGVRHLVVCPGSRSQALALVAAELERSGDAELHVRIDERTAGFLALGIAAESGVPAVVIVTSGTATANLHPAVLEAHHSRLPLIVVTADRPIELRGIRANQTTVQPGLYGDAARLSEDVPAPTGDAGEIAEADRLAGLVWDAAIGLGQTAQDGPGPAQLNLAFREPLSVAVPELDVAASSAGGAGRREAPSVPRPAVPEVLAPLVRTVVIAGNGAGEEAEELARAGGWPLIAEVSSGARFGPNLVVAYRRLLDSPDFGGLVERAVVFGHPTLSRQLGALLARPDVEAIVVDPGGRDFYDPGHRARRASAVAVSPEIDAAAPPSRAWAGRWVFASRRILEESVAPAAAGTELGGGRLSSNADKLDFARSALASEREPITRALLVDAVWRFSWPHDRLVLGASRLIRELDTLVPGKKIRVHSNRGLAGIDGTVATAIGLTLARPRGPDAPRIGATRVLLGDLTLLHDVGSLLFGEDERRPTVQLIVGNDGGGTIFDSLEVAATAQPEAMRRVLYTPQKVELSALARAYGWSYARAATRGELERALSAPGEGPSILEVPLAR